MEEDDERGGRESENESDYESERDDWQEDHTVGGTGDGEEGARRKYPGKKRKKTTQPGRRRRIRGKYESVEDFNPESRSAQTEELERMRRLELQQSLRSSPRDAAVGVGDRSGGATSPPFTTEGGAQNVNGTSREVPGGGLAGLGARGPALLEEEPGAEESDSECNAADDDAVSNDTSEPILVDLTEASCDQSTAIVIDSSEEEGGEEEDSNDKAASSSRLRGEKTKAAPLIPSGSSVARMKKAADIADLKYSGFSERCRGDGRVLVNAGHHDNEPDVLLDSHISRVVQPHQIGGIRFLYDNIVESLGRYKVSDGFGCILAHSMGLGKTLQVIGFIDVYLRYTAAKHVLCIVPVNTLHNWINEFNRWLPVSSRNNNTPPNSIIHSNSTCASTCNSNHGNNTASPLISDTRPTCSNSSSYECQSDGDAPSRLRLFVLSDNTRTMDARLHIITQWREQGGVLLLGYELYRLLSLSVPSLGGNKMAVKRKRPSASKKGTAGTAGGKGAGSGECVIDLDVNEKEMDALITVQKGLCNPGPDLVVCDEGHRIKNDCSNISQALKRIRTKRRVVMTGYPLQNNLIEYWCMVDFVRPKYLGEKQEFCDLFERPISNGQCVDSTPRDVQLMRFRSHVLHALLKGFVLRRGHEILGTVLPPKFEFMLYLRPSPPQALLYDYCVSHVLHGTDSYTSGGPLTAFALCSKVWNHPDIFHDETTRQKSNPAQWLSDQDTAGIIPRSLLSKNNEGPQNCRINWPSHLLPDYKTNCLSSGTKMEVLIALLDMFVSQGDRTLVFSQSLSTLSYIERVLEDHLVPVPGGPNSSMSLVGGTPQGPVQYSSQKWLKNRNFYRLDGSTSSSERDKLINQFNSSENRQCWVFLLSTRAGCLGVNLVGANRVIVVDVSWNPCYDAQAVCRVYRYGQTKPCFIYRMVLDGTMEKKIYERQVSKQGMADRVVDELHPERHFTASEIITLVTPLSRLQLPVDYSSIAEKYSFDFALEKLCRKYGHLLTRPPFKHESLLLDSKDEKMTEVEKYVAMKGFHADWKARQSGYKVGGAPSAEGTAVSSSHLPQQQDQRRPQFPASAATLTTATTATAPANRQGTVPYRVADPTTTNNSNMSLGGSSVAPLASASSVSSSSLTYPSHLLSPHLHGGGAGQEADQSRAHVRVSSNSEPNTSVICLDSEDDEEGEGAPPITSSLNPSQNLAPAVQSPMTYSLASHPLPPPSHTLPPRLHSLPVTLSSSSPVVMATNQASQNPPTSVGQSLASPVSVPCQAKHLSYSVPVPLLSRQLVSTSPSVSIPCQTMRATSTAINSSASIPHQARHQAPTSSVPRQTKTLTYTSSSVPCQKKNVAYTSSPVLYHSRQVASEYQSPNPGEPYPGDVLPRMKQGGYSLPDTHTPPGRPVAASPTLRHDWGVGAIAQSSSSSKLLASTTSAPARSLTSSSPRDIDRTAPLSKVHPTAKSMLNHEPSSPCVNRTAQLSQVLKVRPSPTAKITSNYGHSVSSPSRVCQLSPSPLLSRNSADAIASASLTQSRSNSLTPLPLTHAQKQHASSKAPGNAINMPRLPHDHYSSSSTRMHSSSNAQQQCTSKAGSSTLLPGGNATITSKQPHCSSSLTHHSSQPHAQQQCRSTTLLRGSKQPHFGSTHSSSQQQHTSIAGTLQQQQQQQHTCMPGNAKQPHSSSLSSSLQNRQRRTDTQASHGISVSYDSSPPLPPPPLPPPSHPHPSSLSTLRPSLQSLSSSSAPYSSYRPNTIAALGFSAPPTQRGREQRDTPLLYSKNVTATPLHQVSTAPATSAVSQFQSHSPYQTSHVPRSLSASQSHSPNPQYQTSNSNTVPSSLQQRQFRSLR